MTRPHAPRRKSRRLRFDRATGVLAVALGVGLPLAGAAQEAEPQRPPPSFAAPAPPAPPPSDEGPPGEPAAAASQSFGAGGTQSFGARPRPGASPPPGASQQGLNGPMAGFQLPRGAEHIGRPPRPVTQFLKYQYSWGSESDLTYNRDRDLDRTLRDNTMLAAPQINGYILYRPIDQLEMMLEVVLEKEIAVHEEKVVTLPGGERQFRGRRHPSLAVDQAWIRYKPPGPFDFTLGRRNFEDDRHWLYDTSLDVAVVRFKKANFNVEVSYGRKDAVNLDMFNAARESRTDNYMAYLEYRGIEDIKLAGYAIKRDDRSGVDGKPLLIGARAYGTPTDRFNFWSELAMLRGKDQQARRFRAHAFDVGATYRFPDIALHPALTIGFASGTGDGNPRDDKNTEFRQTGLHSNEFKMAGVSKFKYYGEALDPDLSNLRIFTVGLGFRPSPTIHVDLVYHRYRANEPAEELPNWALTTLMNQDPARPPSKDVGTGLDVVIGFRNLFGVRRLGLDVRAGLFFPGRAFRNEINPEADEPDFRSADKGISVLAKFWY